MITIYLGDNYYWGGTIKELYTTFSKENPIVAMKPITFSKNVDYKLDWRYVVMGIESIMKHPKAPPIKRHFYKIFSSKSDYLKCKSECTLYLDKREKCIYFEN